jgi:uncharacterized Zn-finger protein
MQPFETITVDGPAVACDGTGGVGGHPRVFLNLSAAGQVECPYCSRLFVRRTPGDGHGVETLGSTDPAAHQPPAEPAKP